MSCEPGEIVELRARRWLVERVDESDNDFPVVTLACIDDDAQGEQVSVLWDAEIGPRRLDENPWDEIGRDGIDDAAVFAAFLRTLKWRTATAAQKRLFQAPFRAGIRLDAYQLAPLDKALALPRVNLLIGDDVGLGKTVEAGLVVREMLLRRRIDFIVVAVPPSMTLQWQDELEAKFGLTFDIIDRERLAELRRLRGFSVNPWATGSRFIISHRLLTDETYVAGLRDVLGVFRPRALLILDEAHHAAPASGAKYAVDSQFTRAVRHIAERFEHRLFLTATPHNGHSNSFSSLLEMLDPQRFTRGVPVQPRDLAPVMVRRLKSDLRELGESFPKRIVEPIPLDELPDDAAELVLSNMLSEYGSLREQRLSNLSKGDAAKSRLIYSGLQQRLLSSSAAFAKTLRVHLATMESYLVAAEEEGKEAVAQGAEAFSSGPMELEEISDDLEEEELEELLSAEEDAAAESASLLGTKGVTTEALRAEIEYAQAMLKVAEAAAQKPDYRVRWLLDWIEGNMLEGSSWNERRLIVFTEYEDTRRWLERRLHEALAESDQAEERISVFSGLTSSDRREEIKRAFNADPKTEPVRILLCTDAAREGINLQTRCYDLLHFDLPWNPARLEQRNGRIDRKLQPAKEVFCRYFKYMQREEDVVLDALVRKSETIQDQLGSAGQVISERVFRRLTDEGIVREKAKNLADSIANEADDELTSVARQELGDGEKRLQKVKEEVDTLRKRLEEARKSVGVEPDELRQVVGTALARANYSLDEAEDKPVGNVETFALDPQHASFSHDGAWQAAFDDLRTRPRHRRERMNEWRQMAPPRAIAFEPPVTEDGRDADNVVQVHLEHRLVRRLLGRFLSQGFQSGLNRACVILGPGAQPRVVLLGRIALFGSSAARLHEEIIPVTALWTEQDRGAKQLRPYGRSGEETTLDQLEAALTDARRPSDEIVDRAVSFAAQDIEDLLPTLRKRADSAIEEAARLLTRRGEEEASSLSDLLQDQRKRILKAETEFDDRQLELPGIAENERRQLRADRRHWQERLIRLEEELQTEPTRVRSSYEVRARRLEPVGLVYIWPRSV